MKGLKSLIEENESLERNQQKLHQRLAEEKHQASQSMEYVKELEEHLDEREEKQRAMNEDMLELRNKLQEKDSQLLSLKRCTEAARSVFDGRLISLGRGHAS